MKKSMLIIVAALIWASCSTTAPTADSVQAAEEKIFAILDKNPKKALKQYKKVAKDYETLAKPKQVATAYLNIANIYDERLGQNEAALEYANRSYNAALNMKDTMQMANLLKYKGLLEGRAAQFDLAEQHIKQAIVFYTDKKFAAGVAVSQFDLANVMYEKGDYGKSVFFLNLANEYWRYQKSSQRIFVNHIFGMKLYDKMKQPDKVKTLYRECEQLKSEIDYEGYVKELYEKTVKMLKLG